MDTWFSALFGVVVASVGLGIFEGIRWLRLLKARVRRLEDIVGNLALEPMELPRRPPLPLDNLKDAGVELPADQDDVEAWAEEQRLAGIAVDEETITLQRRMRMEEGL